MRDPVTDHLPLYERPEVYQRRWFLLGVLCLSLVMVVMAVSSVNVALPTLQSELGTSATMLQWIVDSYALVFAGLLLVAGALGDRFGRKEMLLLGLLLFGMGAVVSGFAGSAAIVIVGRAIQGAGAAFVMPATLSLLTAVFPPDERAKAIATWVAFAGAGGALGPIVSGALLEEFWWGSAFLFNLPVVALTAVAIAVYCPRSQDDTDTPLDPPGAVLSLVGLTSLLFGVIEGAERGWTDPFVVGSFVVAAVVLYAFVRWEMVAEHPMLPISYFADRRFSVGSAVITTSFFVMFGWLFLFTLYLQFVRGYSPLEAGLATLPLPPALIIMSPRSPDIAARLGTGRTIALGFLLIGAGMAVLAPVTPDTPYVVLAAGMVLLGAGISMTSAPATTAIIERGAAQQGRRGLGGQRHHSRARWRTRHRRSRQHRQFALPGPPRPRRARRHGFGVVRGGEVDRRGGLGGQGAAGRHRRRPRRARRRGLHRRLRHHRGDLGGDRGRRRDPRAAHVLERQGTSGRGRRGPQRAPSPRADRTRCRGCCGR